jgi:peptidoglycan/LPS O-acetylase OafA/YrhL
MPAVNPIQKGRLPSLDGLRAIAVVLVLLAHAHQTGGFPSSRLLSSLGRIGPIGVEVFFVISGFLITTLMLREKTASGAVHISGFYWRRVIRILPAYFSLLGVVAALQWLGYATLQTQDWVGALTYTVNFLRHPAWEIGHAWSLSIEEHFYLIWPLLMALPVAGLGWRICLGCLVVCPLLRWAVLLLWPEYTQMAELWTFTRLDSIATGALLSFIAWNEVTVGWLDRIVNSRLAAVTAFGMLCLSLAASGYSAKFAVGIAYSVNALCIAMLLWLAVRNPGSTVGRMLNWRPLTFVGVISYSLYLWQQIFLQHGREGWAFRFPQNLIFAVAAAVTSYYVIERPFLLLKDAAKSDHEPTPEPIVPSLVHLERV